ncbi:MAG: ATP-binding protein [Methanomassiliicoccales archaeon]|nr:ATP-binding protein [Methanomassiliicoccales archaeon]
MRTSGRGIIVGTIDGSKAEAIVIGARNTFWTLVKIDPAFSGDLSPVGQVDVFLVSGDDLNAHGEFLARRLRPAFPYTPLFELRERGERSNGSSPDFVQGVVFADSLDLLPGFLNARQDGGIIRRDQDRTTSGADLKRIEWLLEREAPNETSKLVERPLTDQEKKQGSSGRLILDTLGEKVLSEIVLDSLNLLGTSGAVYERDGMCSLGMFSSGWCTFLDDSFRNGEEGNALEQEGNLCHHRCWSATTQLVMDAKGSVDRSCPGGLRIFAVPIVARGQVIGSINIGYGDPPQDLGTLKRISQQHGVDEQMLVTAARSYHSRPPFIIEAAKARLRTSARLIGVIVEKAWAEKEKDVKARELARSNADLEQFAYVASHDLQEPLRMITGYLGLVEKRHGAQLDDEGREFIGYALNGSRRMSNLVNDLLEYSRAGSRQLALEPCDMNTVLWTVRRSLDGIIQKEKADVTSEILPTITADRRQMEQLLQNLVSNAVKFHREQPTHVIITASKQSMDWTFSVRDNGIGIDKEGLDRLFQMFVRLGPRDKYEGTGIGLAICKKIVDRHGGRIWAESTPGVGSTFHFSIPDL